MPQSPQQLANKLGLPAAALPLFTQALTHRSASKNNNERLEYLGDAVLGVVIAEALYHKFPNADEGSLSRFRANLVNQTSLVDIATHYQIADYLILGAGEHKSSGKHRPSILSDAVEAIIGALFIGEGMEVARDWICQVFADKLDDIADRVPDKDAKTTLQELMQAQKIALPKYQLLEASGKGHHQLFTVHCLVACQPSPCQGQGDSIKKAQQNAASKMLKLLSPSR